MSATLSVTIAGASSDLGRVILSKFLASEHFNVRVLKRTGSSTTFPAGADVVEVDFDSVESLQAALAGQDALVSTIGAAGFHVQQQLIDAAAAAGVKRFLPSEFGSDLHNPKTRILPVFRPKVQIQEYLKEKCEASGMSYTLVYNAAFLDWGLSKNFLLNLADYKQTIIDGGDAAFSATTLNTVGDAVVGVLTHLEDTKNRPVYVHDIVVSQNKLLELAKKAAPAKPWEVVPVKLDDLVKRADERLAQGLFDMETFAPYLYRALMDPAYGSDFSKKADNALLGLKGITDDDVLEILKSLLK
jgi:uncharacterized protein YbjT (DUF2867 family)